MAITDTSLTLADIATNRIITTWLLTLDKTDMKTRKSKNSNNDWLIKPQQWQNPTLECRAVSTSHERGWNKSRLNWTKSVHRQDSMNVQEVYQGSYKWLISIVAAIFHHFSLTKTKKSTVFLTKPKRIVFLKKFIFLANIPSDVRREIKTKNPLESSMVRSKICGPQLVHFSGKAQIWGLSRGYVASPPGWRRAVSLLCLCLLHILFTVLNCVCS